MDIDCWVPKQVCNEAVEYLIIEKSSTRAGVHPGRDEVGFTMDRSRLDSVPCNLKVDIGMLSMHRNSPGILLSSMFAKAIGKTDYVWTGHRIPANRVLLSKSG